MLVEPNAVVLIRGDKVCLYKLTSGGTTLLESYSRAEAIVIGEELIEAAVKIQRDYHRKPEAHPCRNPGCEQPTARGSVYCSRACYMAHRRGNRSEEPS
ncbi:MAG: hypothetical protein NTAFB01_13160 [Nitrospira sp.]